MKIDLNKIMAELLQDNKMSKKNEDYKSGYVDGALDFHNRMKKELEKPEEV